MYNFLLKNSLFVHFLKKIYFHGRLLSIDVALGASCTSALFFVLFDQKIELPSLLALFLTVWLIYTLDHLLDARKIKQNVILPRHKFHQKYFSIILLFWLITVLISALFIFIKLSIWTIYTGTTILLLVIIYFLSFQVQRLKKIIVLQKEFMIALIYTLGVLAPVYNLVLSEFSIKVILIIIQIFLLALVNLWEFSLFEVIEDQKQGQQSLATLIGKVKIRRLIFIAIILNYFFVGLILFSYPEMRVIAVEICFFLMNTILLVIMLNQPFFSKFERYRIVGDAIFYIPILLNIKL